VIGMNDISENLESDAEKTSENLPARLAAIESRLEKIEALDLDPSKTRGDDGEGHSIAALSERLSRLETRYENMLKNSPDVRETSDSSGCFAFLVIVIILVILIALGGH
jgi:archaellum component FlaC